MAETKQVHQMAKSNLLREEGGLLHVLGGLYFYRAGMRVMAKALLVSMLVNLILVGLSAYLFWRSSNVEPRYFATSSDGKLMEMRPLHESMVSDATIMRFATEVATSVYTFDFANYRSQLQSNAHYFTDNGWNQFLVALENAKVIDMITERRLVLSAVPQGSPVMVAKGRVNGRHAWKVRVPVQISYHGSTQTNTREVMITLTILRTTGIERERGYAVSQFIESSL